MTDFLTLQELLREEYDHERQTGQHTDPADEEPRYVTPDANPERFRLFRLCDCSECGGKGKGPSQGHIAREERGLSLTRRGSVPRLSRRGARPAGDRYLRDPGSGRSRDRDAGARRRVGRVPVRAARLRGRDRAEVAHYAVAAVRAERDRCGENARQE